ncbi:TPA: helix-turn-helix domain-containing protein [Klebsiella pneumoniae]|uniref:helix-turn-helix domain-containing protein n=1 Tax=Klebsiella pneumoniae TaxID=573 RepID=UPI000E343706|nr:helix-turn-helix domain-containing protein [Klebsiella pneumoniae]EIV5299691.1 helix-turn-helix domain-containing protein [Klebsiella pneumoniae]EKZ9761241.1 helix-turn-helix domain-containing protein [Klebsiella pneumoniae]MBL0822329.1 helix-turn-helix domain-containing protein [Klebsiella pneumoniae]MBQ5186117.1 helix-turn-helix domain-containing protein [Klebsiella pneumoniae]MCP6202169.1 helix-turn-helix domain-containing protein [Klebsiella pneumoniae]
MRKNTHQADNPQVLRLNEIIDQKRISKADIARICGVSSQSVNNWFVRGAIGKSSAIKLADALGVSLEWVLGQDVDSKDGLRPDERRLLELYNQLPNEEEQQNILRIISLRLKELDELYAKYMGRRIKGDME